MLNPVSRRRSCAIITATALALLPSFFAQAASVTWDGGGGSSNTAWSTAANWSGNTVPASTDDLYFGTNISSGAVISLGSARTASSLTFTTNTSFAIGSGGSPNFTITSGTITASGTSGEQDVLAPLYTSAGAGWDITVSNANDTLGLGDLYQTGTGTRGIALYGSGKITMPSDSNMTGGVTIYGPTVSFPQGNTLPDVTISSGTGIITGANSESFTVSGTGNGGGVLQATANNSAINNLIIKGNTTIGGSGQLTINGALSDSNNGYTLTDNAYSLDLASSSPNFAGTINVTSSSTLVIDNNTAAGPASSGAINVAAGGTLFIGDSVTLNKTISMAAGSSMYSGLSSTVSGTVTVAGNPNFGAAGDGELLTVTGNIVDTLSVHSGINLPTDSQLTLLGNNTFHNGITVGDSSVLVLGANNSSGSGAVVGLATSTVDLANNATVASSITAGNIGVLSGNDTIGGAKLFYNYTFIDVPAGMSLTINGPVSDAQANGTLQKSSPGRLILTSAGTFDGGSVIDDGAVAITNGSALGTGQATFFHESTQEPVLEISGSITGTTPLELESGETATTTTPIVHATAGNNTWTGPIDLEGYTEFKVDVGASLTLSVPITGSGGGLIKTGGGNLILNAANSLYLLNVLSGDVVIAANVAAPSSIPFTATSGGTIALASGITSSAVTSLSGAGFSSAGALRATSGSAIQNGAVHLLGDASIGADAGAILAINSVIDDGGLGYALTKVGNGTVSLNNTNTYSGGTNIAGGKLRISADAALGVSSTAITITNAATLEFSSSFATARTINANNGSLSPDSGVVTSLAGAYVNGGNLRGPGTFTLASNTTLNSSTSLQGSVLNQTGSASLLNFTNGGTLTNAAALTWDTGSNAATGTLNVNSTLAVDNFANYSVLNVANGATLTNTGTTPLILASGSITTVSSGGIMSLTNSQPLDLSDSLLTNNGTISGSQVNISYGGLATGTGSWPAVYLSAGGTFSPGDSPAALTPNFTTTAYIQPTPGVQSVATAVTLLTNTIADVTNATDSLTLTSQLSASGVTLTKIHPGTLSLTNIRSAGLVVTDGILVILPLHTDASTSSLNSLSITGAGHFDLTENNLVLDYTGASPLTAIRQYLQSGALMSSSASGYSSPGTALGYAEASNLPAATASLIAGTLPYDSTTVLVKYTWLGDSNLDGMITTADLTMISSSGTTWSTGDFNYDGVVNADDYSLFMLGLSKSSGVNIYATLPEPSLLLASAFWIVTSRLQRRR